MSVEPVYSRSSSSIAPLLRRYLALANRVDVLLAMEELLLAVEMLCAVELLLIVKLLELLLRMEAAPEVVLRARSGVSAAVRWAFCDSVDQERRGNARP